MNTHTTRTLNKTPYAHKQTKRLRSVISPDQFRLRTKRPTNKANPPIPIKLLESEVGNPDYEAILQSGKTDREKSDALKRLRSRDARQSRDAEKQDRKASARATRPRVVAVEEEVQTEKPLSDQAQARLARSEARAKRLEAGRVKREEKAERRAALRMAQKSVPARAEPVPVGLQEDGSSAPWEAEGSRGLAERIAYIKAVHKAASSIDGRARRILSDVVSLPNYQWVMYLIDEMGYSLRGSESRPVLEKKDRSKKLAPGVWRILEKFGELARTHGLDRPRANYLKSLRTQFKGDVAAMIDPLLNIAELPEKRSQTQALHDLGMMFREGGDIIFIPTASTSLEKKKIAQHKRHALSRYQRWKAHTMYYSTTLAKAKKMVKEFRGAPKPHLQKPLDDTEDFFNDAVAAYSQGNLAPIEEYIALAPSLMTDGPDGLPTSWDKNLKEKVTSRVNLRKHRSQRLTHRQRSRNPRDGQLSSANGEITGLDDVQGEGTGEPEEVRVQMRGTAVSGTQAGSMTSQRASKRDREVSHFDVAVRKPVMLQGSRSCMPLGWTKRHSLETLPPSPHSTRPVVIGEIEDMEVCRRGKYETCRHSMKACDPDCVDPACQRTFWNSEAGHLYARKLEFPNCPPETPETPVWPDCPPAPMYQLPHGPRESAIGSSHGEITEGDDMAGKKKKKVSRAETERQERAAIAEEAAIKARGEQDAKEEAERERLEAEKMREREAGVDQRLSHALSNGARLPADIPEKITSLQDGVFDEIPENQMDTSPIDLSYEFHIDADGYAITDCPAEMITRGQDVAFLLSRSGVSAWEHAVANDRLPSTQTACMSEIPAPWSKKRIVIVALSHIMLTLILCELVVAHAPAMLALFSYALMIFWYLWRRIPLLMGYIELRDSGTMRVRAIKHAMDGAKRQSAVVKTTPEQEIAWGIKDVRPPMSRPVKISHHPNFADLTWKSNHIEKGSEGVMCWRYESLHEKARFDYQTAMDVMISSVDSASIDRFKKAYMSHKGVNRDWKGRGDEGVASDFAFIYASSVDSMRKAPSLNPGATRKSLNWSPELGLGTKP